MEVGTQCYQDGEYVTILDYKDISVYVVPHVVADVIALNNFFKKDNIVIKVELYLDLHDLQRDHEIFITKGSEQSL